MQTSIRKAQIVNFKESLNMYIIELYTFTKRLSLKLQTSAYRMNKNVKIV